MKDHEKRELVSALTEVAVSFRDTQQLRARIADIVLPAISDAEAIIAAKDAEYTTLAQNGGRQLSKLLDKLSAAQAHIEALRDALSEPEVISGSLIKKRKAALAIQTSDEALRKNDAEQLAAELDKS